MTRFLKEDGSLDVERIRKLPIEEKDREIGIFTREQMKEYISKLPINETMQNTIKVVKVDYTMEDLLARGYCTSDDIHRILTT